MTAPIKTEYSNISSINDKFFKILKNTFFGTLKYVQNDGKTHSSQKY